MKKFFHLDFIPRSTDLALFALRVVFGLGMLWLHGRGKLMDFSKLSSSFPDPLGIGHPLSLALDIVGEVVCPALVFVGAFTRFAALGTALTMGVAFFKVHDAKLMGSGNGEIALLYCAAFAALFFAGAGRLSIDTKLGAKS